MLRYSAKRHQGVRYYEFARQGIEIARKPVGVEIHELRLLRFEPPEFDISVIYHLFNFYFILLYFKKKKKIKIQTFYKGSMWIGNLY